MRRKLIVALLVLLVLWRGRRSLSLRASRSLKRAPDAARDRDGGRDLAAPE